MPTETPPRPTTSPPAKMPPAPPPGPQWTSPPAATVSPDTALTALAGRLSVAASSLATVEVPCTCSTLYNSALEYAALHPRPPAAPPLPLWQNPDDALYPVSDSESESDSDDDSDDDDGGLSELAAEELFGTRKGAAAAQYGKGADDLLPRKTPVPRLVFGLGECRVSWPPPEGMPKGLAGAAEEAAEAMAAADPGGASPAEKKKKKRRKKKRKSRTVGNFGMKNNKNGTENSNKSDDVSSENQQDGQNHVDELSDDGDDDDDESWAGNVYYIHTAQGDPISLGDGEACVYRTLLLVAETAAALRIFTKGVVKWRADKDHRPPSASRFALYRFKSENNCGYWQLEGVKHARPTSSVILPKGLLPEILDDLSLFLARDTRRWYVKHGLPHRRSFIFSGPPGTGKTSCIRALASTFRLNLCFLSATSKTFHDQLLGDALGGRMPRNALLVIEDVDSLFDEDRKNAEGGLLTFSAFLNALDGFLSADGVVTVMTTNHIEKLDAALTRGGRVDRRFEFARPIQSQIADLFSSFYPDAEKELAEEFAAAVFARPEGDEARSIATLQQHFIAQRRVGARACVDALPAFFAVQFPNGVVDKNSLYM